MAFKDALKNAKKKGGKKVPPKGSKDSKGNEDMTADEATSGRFQAALANAKKKKK